MDELFAKVERAKKEWEATVDAISEGVILYELDTLAIRRANRMLALMVNSEPKDMCGADAHDVLCGCQSANCPVREVLRSKEPIIREIDNPRFNQQWLYSTYQISGLDDQPTTAVLVVQDVTRERLMQKQYLDAEKKAVMLRTVSGLVEQVTPSLGYMQHYLAKLTSQVAELRRAFVDYRIALQASRPNTGPLNGLNLETIESRYRVEFTLQDFSDVLNLCTNDLQKVFTAINRLSVLETDAPEMEVNEIHHLLESSIEFLKSEAVQDVHFGRIYADETLSICCNPLRMKLALTGLLSFLARGVTPRDEIRVGTKKINHHAQIVMQAEPERPGPERAPIEPSQTFEKDMGSKDLNLELIENIIQDHGGEVRFDSTSNHLQKVTIRLPLTS